ncbi:hypothetical protein GH714_037172 [Hevea brasiliensis]|uniref:Uncharacterized protein n=1 Tax=Hevea brasiliensis TaxID=3981 RepID=A0A6A6KNB0_HEVBR|nr:hypothetical protein GH714_037172 [Hevea brasiliensis]
MLSKGEGEPIELEAIQNPICFCRKRLIEQLGEHVRKLKAVAYHVKRVFDKPPFKKRNFSKAIGHTKGSCFKLIGYPNRNKQRRGKFTANGKSVYKGFSVTKTVAAPRPSQEWTDELANLIQQTNLIQQELMKLMRGKIVNEAGCVKYTSFTGKVSTSLHLGFDHNVLAISIIDSGATSHVF